MAQDNNERPPAVRNPPPGATAPPDHVNQPQVYEIFHGSKPEDRDGSISTTGSNAATPQAQEGGNKRPTVSEGFKTIKKDDWFRIHQIPCAREGFMTGIVTGFVTGSGRLIAGGKLSKSLNWGVGGFLISSLVGWEYCQSMRRKEKAAMARVVEVIDRKKAEKMKQAEEAARKRKEAAEKAKEEAAKRWYKFW
ncbi:ribosomal protein YmL8 [Apiospora arundinis]